MIKRHEFNKRKTRNQISILKKVSIQVALYIYAIYNILYIIYNIYNIIYTHNIYIYIYIMYVYDNIHKNKTYINIL